MPEFPISLCPDDQGSITKKIQRGIKRAIASGNLERGRKVPAIRETAEYFEFSPTTVAKAYKALIKAGILQVRERKGTFVPDPQAGGRGANGQLHDMISDLLIESEARNIRLEDVLEMVKQTSLRRTQSRPFAKLLGL